MPETNNEIIMNNEQQRIGEVISDDNSPSFDLYKFKAFSNKFVSPGTLVAAEVDENGGLLIGRVIASHEQNPHFSPDRVAVRHSLQIPNDHPGEEFSAIIYRIYEVETLSQLYINNGEHIIKPPEILPRSGFPIIIPSEEIIAKVLGIQTDTNNGLCIGNLASTIAAENNVSVILNRDIIQRHVFIGGTTGSGKSYAAKVLAEEIHKQGLPIIFFDTQNEFVPLTEQLHGLVLRPGVDYTIRLSQLTESEIFGMVPSLTTDLQVSVLAMAFLRLSRSGQDFNLSHLIEAIRAWGPEAGIDTRTIGLVVMRVEHYIRNYDFIGQGIDWNEILRRNAVIDIDCSGVNRERLQIILAATMRELQNLRRSNQILPYVLVIDEAHLFVPQDEESSAKQIIREGVRIGRHHGICLILITQSPMDIDKKAIRQCNTRLIFAMEPDQLQSLQGVKADATENMLNKLPKSPRGICILSGTYETIKHAIPVQIREMETEGPDAGQAPAIFDILSSD